MRYAYILLKYIITGVCMRAFGGAFWISEIGNYAGIRNLAKSTTQKGPPFSYFFPSFPLRGLEIGRFQFGITWILSCCCQRTATLAAGAELLESRESSEKQTLIYR